MAAHPLSRRLDALEARTRPPRARVVWGIVLPSFCRNWTPDSWERFRAECISGGLDPGMVPGTPAEAIAGHDEHGRLRVPCPLPPEAWSLMVASITGPRPGELES
jgi:hypothetical protein